ncbi:DUF4062 domain-containing protein [Burkholderia ubonensis]|uniref:DUF4062 domain-containing protein n=1 Tax=Burkholderia ubonensis TaxID=101571 RepID=UPI0009B36D14|nr:DUF4062 domain-containing protein [Burkholderia ubonensis]
MLLKKTVFLASRFEAFSELRVQLKQKITNYPHLNLSAIDLDDGRVNHYPPLVECLAHVRRSNYMILLLGDEYGGLAPDRAKSFTHLEYEEAVRDGAGTRVLVFCIGERYRGGQIQFVDPETPFGQWQREIEKRHTIGFVEPDIPVDQMAHRIFESFLAAHFAMEFGQIRYEPEDQHRDLFDAISDGKALDDSDVTTLESRDSEQTGPSLLDDAPQCSGPLAALLQPAAVAAYEQRVEARRAIELADYGCAIRHLQRALEHRPLDLMSNFWLASLYVNLGRKPDCERAKELSERAARIALGEGAPFRAAASYMLAARAGHITGQLDGALAYARQAVEAAPSYAKARIELARSWLATGVQDQAMKEIERAANLYFPSLREVFVDPLFSTVRTQTNELIESLRRQLIDGAVRILVTERQLATMVGQLATGYLPDDIARKRAIDVAKASVAKQQEWVRTLIGQAEVDVAKLTPTNGSVRFELDSEILILNERVRVNSAMLAAQEADHGHLVGWSARLGTYWSIAGALVGFLIAIRSWSYGSKLNGFLMLLVSAGLMYLGYRAHRRYRLRLTGTRDKIGLLKAELSRFADRQAALGRQLAEWQHAAKHSTERAREALRLFEKGTLSQSNRLLFPFASLFSGRQGDLVRVIASQRDWFSEQTGRTIEESQALPEWLEEHGEFARSGVGLFRLERVESKKVVLSRAAAYASEAK